MARALKFLPISEKASRKGFKVGVDDICAVYSVEMTGFATISPEDEIIDEVINPSAANPLAILNVRPFKGTQFTILSDGEIYYFIKSRVKQGITHLMLDYTLITQYGGLSEVDQMMVKESIRQFGQIFA